MKVEATALTGANYNVERTAVEAINRQRKGKESGLTKTDSLFERNKIAQEEIVTEIKNLAQHGLYSVRFEMNEEADELIIQVVEQESGELIRQIPYKELVEASKRLKDFRGLIIETES